MVPCHCCEAGRRGWWGLLSGKDRWKGRRDKDVSFGPIYTLYFSWDHCWSYFVCWHNQTLTVFKEISSLRHQIRDRIRIYRFKTKQYSILSSNLSNMVFQQKKVPETSYKFLKAHLLLPHLKILNLWMCMLPIFDQKVPGTTEPEELN